MPQTVLHVFRMKAKNCPLKDWLDELESDEPRAYRKMYQRMELLADKGE